MTPGARALAVVLGLAMLWALGPGVGAQGPPSRVPPAPADVDLLGIRDIFRYADEPAPVPGSLTGLRAVPADGREPEEAPPRSRARLVGFVERSGRLVAAVSIDGEVMLLGEGQSARGFTVVDIEDETVRLRDSDGHVESLRLP